MMRAIPDIAMIASPDFPGVFVFDDSDCIRGSGCGNDVPKFTIIGGTSLSAPIWTGISKLIVQKTGSRLGNMDTQIYNLASANQSGNGFRDVTTGNNNFNGVTGFVAVPGYDEATGWGTVDINNFVSVFAGSSPSATPTPTPTPTSAATSTAAPTGTPTPTLTPTATPTPTSTPNPVAKVAAAVKVSQPSVNFGKVKVGASKIKVVTLTNTAPRGGPAVTFEGATITGSSDFVGATNCVAAVSPKGKCTLTLGFAPSVTGAQSASVTINSNASNSPQRLSISGIGR